MVVSEQAYDKQYKNTSKTTNNQLESVRNTEAN